MALYKKLDFWSISDVIKGEGSVALPQTAYV